MIYKRSAFYNRILYFYFFSVLFLTPYGFGVGPETVWITDAASLIVLFIFSSFILIGIAKLPHYFYRLNVLLVMLYTFFFLEFFLPIVGVFVWADPSSASSSIRALIYWSPAILIFLLLNPADSRAYRKIDGLILFALAANVFIGFVEVLIYFGFLPDDLNYRNYLSWAAPQERFLRESIRSSGFFQNATAYAIFGFLSFIHYLSKLIIFDDKKVKYFVLLLFSFLIILLSTSRAPLAAAFLCFSLYFVFIRKTVWNLFLSVILVSLGVVVLASLFLVEAPFFSRFNRLIDGGLVNDYSLGVRMFELWPSALSFYFELGHPVFTNPTKYVGTIDSGYLTLFLQGGWLMVAVVLAMLLSSVFLPFLRIKIYGCRDYFSYFLLFLGVYLLFGMIVSNPIRNPLVIAFFCFGVFGFCSRLNREVKS